MENQSEFDADAEAFYLDCVSAAEETAAASPIPAPTLLSGALIKPDEHYKKINLHDAFRLKPPKLEFVIPGFLSGTVGNLSAAGGSGKSFLALEIALSVACGSDLFGIVGEDPQARKVLYLALEDPEEIFVRRLYSMHKHLTESADRCHTLTDVERELIEANLTIFPLYGQGFVIPIRYHDGTIDIHPSMVPVEKFLKANPDCFVILDTFNRALGAGLKETDNTDMSEVLRILEGVCRRTRATIMFVHHVSKEALRAGASDQSASRGASVLIDNVRFALNLVSLTKEDAALIGTPEEDRKNWVRFINSKVNYSEKSDENWLRRYDDGILQAADIMTNQGGALEIRVQKAPGGFRREARPRKTYITPNVVNPDTPPPDYPDEFGPELLPPDDFFEGENLAN